MSGAFTCSLLRALFWYKLLILPRSSLRVEAGHLLALAKHWKCLFSSYVRTYVRTANKKRLEKHPVTYLRGRPLRSRKRLILRAVPADRAKSQGGEAVFFCSCFSSADGCLVFSSLAFFFLFSPGGGGGDSVSYRRRWGEISLFFLERKGGGEPSAFFPISVRHRARGSSVLVAV